MLSQVLRIRHPRSSLLAVSRCAVVCALIVCVGFARGEQETPLLVLEPNPSLSYSTEIALIAVTNSLYLNQIHVSHDLRMHIAAAFAPNPQYLSTPLLLSLLIRSQPQYSQPLHNTAEPSRVFCFLTLLVSCLLPLRSFAFSSATLPTLCIV